MQTEAETIDSLDIGEFIRQERESVGWTRNKLSVESGVNKSCIAYYETGVTQPSFDTVNKLLSALNFQIVLRKRGNESQEDRVQNIRKRTWH